MSGSVWKWETAPRRGRPETILKLWLVPAAATTAAAAVATTATAAAVATTATAAAAAVATTTAAATTTATAFAGFGFVHGQGPAIQHRPVKGLHGGITTFAHLDERESAWSAGFPVHDELHLGDGAVLLERLS